MVRSDDSSAFGFHTIVFVLGPGCGKGTLCKAVTGRPDINEAHYTHLSLGDHLRELCKQDVKTQDRNVDYDKIREHLKENKLLPADVLIPVLEHKMGDRFSTTWLIDGFPRNLETALAFEKTASTVLPLPSLTTCLGQLGKPDMVIVLECERATAEARFLKRGRESADDKERFARRYAEYVENMKAIREHYRKQGDIRLETICTDMPLEDSLGDFGDSLLSVSALDRDGVEKEWAAIQEAMGKGHS
ncbi:hypothetical protein PG996_015889 [Apiospora saccharicola]|uniref:Adenylate kinase n=1 Tax=Apiospora saccharicola TaxID=335842 RepID=A0ABR1TPK8_9PEZI